jgi:hypothetical protein
MLMTLLELFSFLSPLVRLVQSLSKGSWETALTGGLIPLVQFGWKWWHQRSVENQAERVREKVVSLHRFLEALKDDAEHAVAAKLLDDARGEREEAILKLSQLAAARVLPDTSERSLLQRWFLFYAPTGFVSLILHVLFYVSLTAILLMSALVVPIGLSDSATRLGAEIGFGFWLVLVLAFRSVAVAVDTPGVPSRLERWLLLYKPSHPTGWILRGLFYASLLFVLVLTAALVPIMKLDNDSGMMLLGFGVLAAVPLLLRSLIALLERTREPNRFERWLLLYRPVQVTGWILRAVFYVSLIATSVVLTVMLGTTKGPDSDLQGSLMGLALCAGLAFFSRGLTVALERTHEPTRFERWFLLYRPTRRAGWILHGLFYLCIYALLVLFPTLFEASTSDDMRVAIGVLTMYVFLVILFRGLAIDFDPNASPSNKPGWFRRLLLLYSPSRPALWILHVLFYLIVGSALSGLPFLIEDPAETLFVVGYVWFIALCLREFAIEYHSAPTVTPRWAKWLILGRPSRPLAWIPRTILYSALLLLPPLFVNAFRDANDNLALRALRENVELILRGIVPTALIAIASRAWAAYYELPENTLDFTMAGKMSTIRKVLLLYSPARAAGWVPHTLFYLVGLVLIATVGNFSVLRIQNLSSRLIFELMLVCLLVSVWGWASEKTGLSSANK